MDRKLSIKEKIRARSKHYILPLVFLICLIGANIALSSHVEIYEQIAKVRETVTEIINLASFVIESIGV